MSDTKIEITRIGSVELHNIINLMTGGSSYKLLRTKIQEKILEVWPEIKSSDKPTLNGEVRKLILTSREQKAIAEGLLALANKKGKDGEDVVNGQDFNFILGIAKKCKISKWFISKVEEEEVPEFEEELDDEMSLSDESE